MLCKLSLLLAAQLGSVIGEKQQVLASSGQGLDHIRDKYN